MEITNKNRKGYLDIAKAIGLIIVLINHAELSLGGLNRFLGAFYVSEFFLIAGMTFKIKPEETTGEFIGKKVKRLLFPYAAYSGFYLLWYSLRTGMSGNLTGADFLKKLAGCLYARNYLYTAGEEKVYLMEIMNAPMWFLPALFVSLVMYYLLSRYLREKKGYGIFAAFALSMIFHYFVPVLMPWSIDTALAMLPLIYAGERFAKANIMENEKKQWWKVIIVVFFLCVYFNGAGNISIGDYGKSMVLFLLSSVTGTYLCLLVSCLIEKYLHFPAKALIIVGTSTLDVLCMHLFVFALLQTAFSAVGMDISTVWIKMIMIIMGLTVPVIFSRILEQINKKRDKKV